MGKRFGNDPPEPIIEIIDKLLNIICYSFQKIGKFSEICKSKSQVFQNDTHYEMHEKAKINIALAFREFFQCFPLFAISYYHTIEAFIISDGDYKIKSIVFPDFIRFCPQEDISIWAKSLKIFYNGISDKESLFDSIYALAIILIPQYFKEEESIKQILDAIASYIIDSRNEIKNIVLFFFLQVFQNYPSLFEVYDIFWEIFNDDICSLPDYCIFYLNQSLDFLIENFQNKIPEEKIGTLQEVIQTVKEKL